MFARVSVGSFKMSPRVSARRPSTYNAKHQHAAHTPTSTLNTHSTQHVAHTTTPNTKHPEHTQHSRGPQKHAFATHKLSKHTFQNNDIPLSYHFCVVWTEMFSLILRYVCGVRVVWEWYVVFFLVCCVFRGCCSCVFVFLALFRKAVLDIVLRYWVVCVRDCAMCCGMFSFFFAVSHQCVSATHWKTTHDMHVTRDNALTTCKTHATPHT